MEVITEHKETSKTLTPISQETDDPHTVTKPSTEETIGHDDSESVVVTTTAVEETEVSVVNMVQDEEGGHNEVTEREKEGLFGNLVDEDEGLKVNCSENGTSPVMEVDTALAGQNGSFINSIFEHEEENASADPMDICPPEQNEDGGNEETAVNREDSNGKELASHVEEEDHKFVVGDFVWGKIKNKLWWPGQIYDPSDASDNAASLKHDGELLVAYFGDRSFSWCSLSQLKPFIDNFQEMSRQSDSKKFVNAVRKVLQEVGRRVELMCKGNTNDKGGVANSGIKKGVRAPKGNTIKVLIDRLEPVELVSTLKGYAIMEPGAGLVELEFTVLKSCLTAFYTRNGSSEGETRRAVIGPSSEDGDAKLHQKRKKKSVAELMGEDESKVKKAKPSKDKRKALVVTVTVPESDESGGGGDGLEEEAMSPRQRRKSRYLSPPYLSPVGLGRLSVLGSGTGSGSFKEPKTEPEKVPEMAAKQLEDSLKKSSGKKAKEHKKVDAGGSVANMLDGLLCAALDPSLFVQKEKNLPEIMELVSSFQGSIFKEGSCKQTGTKKEGEEDTSKKEGEEDTSELGFIKQKLEWMSEMVQMCEDSEMNADVKATLYVGLQEVLGKVVKMEGK
ncbi:uncharacterized protein LOC143633577 [Bidens hawaiensis]|uniref:uncharacterized protein LOC143633577 n=1 Tax=Bidens hawaiensis TaxID=980011 RepID=UPI00404A2481